MQQKPTINIIGAGILGLCAGSYLQMNGFETQIFEKHSIPGGLCTSWQNGEYTIDGSIHWILGSNEGSGFNKMWSELIDMKKVPFHNHDIRLHIDLKNNALINTATKPLNFTPTSISLEIICSTYLLKTAK
ncbi:MAG: NAD(P)/FAD-dependent oxidoreductase [Bacteroidetes bacterium]|nr:NAD(P)/FAD-dependent oxidoreductase [Bacteroidota bacterium]